MKKSWWTIDRVIMLLTIAGLLFGWGRTTGKQGEEIADLKEDKIELEAEVETLKEKHNDQEIKISLNTDAVGDFNDIIRGLLRSAGSTEEGD